MGKGEASGRSVNRYEDPGRVNFAGNFMGQVVAALHGVARAGASSRGGGTGSGGNTVKPGAVFWPGPASWRTCSHRCPLQTSQRGKFKLLQHTTNFVRPLKCTTRPEGGKLRVDRKRGFENSFPAWGNCILKFLSLSH